jgi:uncharacterized cupredoxin-like copper-binding protein
LHLPASKPAKRLATVAVLGAAALSLVAAGCGDDEDTTVSTTTPTTTEAGATGATGAAGGGETVDISETDFALDPSDVSTKAGTVTFNVSNDGDTTHNLEVEGSGVEEELPADLAPGDSGKLSVDLEPGTYTMYCPVDGHRDQGMEGTVEVK